MQISLFDGHNKFKIGKPIRLIELFGGYGSQHFALEYLGVQFEQWKLCEWAVKSIQAYKDAHCRNDNTDYSALCSDEYIYEKLCKWEISANYNEPMTPEQIKRLGTQKQRQIYNNIMATHNLVNIQQVHAKDLDIQEIDKYCYIMTYSFPCQDLSLAGKRAGMEKGGGTRSGMLWEVERILDECENLPQVLLMENVPEVIGTKNMPHFAKWLEKLESLGYHCYWQVLNGKDYGVPQNRERCFMVSILGDYFYEFPNPISLEHKLKDLLEDNVEEKYYLSESGIKYVISRTPIGDRQDNRASNIISKNAERNAGTITTSTTYRGEDNYIVDNLSQDEINEKIYLKTKLCNELIQSGRVQEYDVIRHSYSQRRLDGEMKDIQQNNISPTLDTRCDCLGVVKDLRIRKLTPRECFRLMGVKDKDFDKIAKNQSNASLYHLAGDSIIVDVLMAIFKNML